MKKIKETRIENLYKTYTYMPVIAVTNCDRHASMQRQYNIRVQDYAAGCSFNHIIHGEISKNYI